MKTSMGTVINVRYFVRTAMDLLIFNAWIVGKELFIMGSARKSARLEHTIMPTEVVCNVIGDVRSVSVIRSVPSVFLDIISLTIIVFRFALITIIMAEMILVSYVGKNACHVPCMVVLIVRKTTTCSTILVCRHVQLVLFIMMGHGSVCRVDKTVRNVMIGETVRLVLGITT